MSNRTSYGNKANGSRLTSEMRIKILSEVGFNFSNDRMSLRIVFLMCVLKHGLVIQY